MDRNQNTDERVGQSTSSNSRHIMWKLSEEDNEETYDSVVTCRRSSSQPTADCKDMSTKHRRASENWQLLLRKLEEKRVSLPEGEPSKQIALKTNPSSATSLPELKELSSKERAVTNWQRFRKGINKQQQGAQEKEVAAEEKGKEPGRVFRCKPSHESLEHKRSKSLGSDRFPSTSPGSMSSKMLSDLILESFSLPPQQSCVVREEAPKFAHGLRVDPVELKVPQNSPVLDLDPNPPKQQQSVRSDPMSISVSAPTSSSFAEAPRQGTSPIKRRSTTGKVATGTKGASSTTTVPKGQKMSNTSSGSTGSHLPNLRQRQQELHRYRVLIEQRRLDLLELKIAREREEAIQSTILFHKKLQINESKIKVYADNDCSNV